MPRIPTDDSAGRPAPDPAPAAQLTRAMIERGLARIRVAYFSMEIAIWPEMPTYSGGLGCWPATRRGRRLISICRWCSSPWSAGRAISGRRWTRRATRRTCPIRGSRRPSLRRLPAGRGADRGPRGLGSAVALRPAAARPAAPCRCCCWTPMSRGERPGRPPHHRPAVWRRRSYG